VTETIIENKACTKVDQWLARIAEQERSGLSIKQFCKERGLTAWSFYDWRKRLRESAGPVRFALVERNGGVRNALPAPMSKSYSPVERNCASGPE
jgi:hypothetical protein